MTMRSAMETDRKAPKVTRLELHRETVQELAEGEVETVVGGKKNTQTYTCYGSCGCNTTARPFCRSAACTDKPTACGQLTCPRRPGAIE